MSASGDERNHLVPAHGPRSTRTGIAFENWLEIHGVVCHGTYSGLVVGSETRQRDVCGANFGWSLAMER